MRDFVLGFGAFLDAKASGFAKLAPNGVQSANAEIFRGKILKISLLFGDFWLVIPQAS